MSDLDITQTGDTAIITLPGPDVVIGRVRAASRPRGKPGWHAFGQDSLPLGHADERRVAAEMVYEDWQRRFEGARECAPTSQVALARELHRMRGHVAPVKRERNWMCSCAVDAVLISGTRWLEDVKTAAAGG